MDVHRPLPLPLTAEVSASWATAGRSLGERRDMYSFPRGAPDQRKVLWVIFREELID